jgi:hypothetical protein
VLVAFDLSEAAGVSTYTALVKQDGDWWTGWVEEVPGVNVQELTREGLVVSLKAVLQEALEMNRDETAAPSQPARLHPLARRLVPPCSSSWPAPARINA